MARTSHVVVGLLGLIVLGTGGSKLSILWSSAKAEPNQPVFEEGQEVRVVSNVEATNAVLYHFVGVDLVTDTLRPKCMLAEGLHVTVLVVDGTRVRVQVSESSRASQCDPKSSVLVKSSDIEAIPLPTPSDSARREKPIS